MLCFCKFSNKSCFSNPTNISSRHIAVDIGVGFSRRNHVAEAQGDVCP